jgi:hypothetical protein
MPRLRVRISGGAAYGDARIHCLQLVDGRPHLLELGLLLQQHRQQGLFVLRLLRRLHPARAE